MVTIDIKDIQQYIGREIGISRWVEITQSRVSKFAEATGNFQWVHVDAERARTELPSGQTIIHNFLLLSLIPQFFDQIVSFSGLEYGLNRGAEKIRFIKPLATGSKIRIRLKLSKLEYHDQKGQTATFHIVMEEEGSDAPVLIMDLQLRFVAAVRKAPDIDRHPGLSDHHKPVALGL